MIFEQPKHLNEVRYRRTARIFRPALVVYLVLMPMVMYIALWSQVEIAEKVSIARWLECSMYGLMGPLYLWGLMRFEASWRRYIEFRGERIFLAMHGEYAIARVKGWSFTPYPDDPRLTRLLLTISHRKNWSMLLDDENQIAQLRQELEIRVPSKS